MKRLLLLLCLLLWLPLQAAETWLVGFAQDTLANDWRKAQVRDVQEALAKHPNIRFVVTDAQGETALQARHIEDLLLQGVDVLITSPRDQVALAPVIRRVHEAGVPVILLSRGIEGDSFTSFVYHDNQALARQAAEYLVEQLQGQGHILMLEGIPGASTTVDRREGFLAVTREHPGIRVTQRTANFLRADAIMAVDQLLLDGQRFDAIYAQSDSMAAGARLALQRHGIDLGSVPLVGIDFIREAQAAIRAGHQSMSFTFPTGGREGAALVLQLLAGEPVPRYVLIPSEAVTINNVELMEPIF
ncbi:substrate-binding domain-containing protein [Marinospirillum alkaliphilum]|uniref:Ribose transport system substrate-binding protein n=1 Tax=Marinospirillum alkaliphilum DSM 21637 TaxID=1122209 RepID=A0A1K1X403_9GAMM|nr:substrate-binding domain-containing protein [Marinospirillum alkaliphilum]SFX43884.1 ribose transport system substrate-binding protein [Marinospirillum alkaliphilum DSM 21637]